MIYGMASGEAMLRFGICPFITYVFIFGFHYTANYLDGLGRADYSYYTHLITKVLNGVWGSILRIHTLLHSLETYIKAFFSVYTKQKYFRNFVALKYNIATRIRLYPGSPIKYASGLFPKPKVSLGSSETCF